MIVPPGGWGVFPLSGTCREVVLTTSTFVHPWYAIQVWSRQEQAIASVLSAKGFETLAPSYAAVRLVSGRRRKFDLALFPGYIFCRMDPNHRLHVITAPGVISILGNGKQAIPVEEEEIRSIQRAVSSGLKAEPFGTPKIGERVRLGGGPLAGLEGVVVSHKGQPRLIVSVTLLNRSMAVEIEQDWVNPSERAILPVLYRELPGAAPLAPLR
jgi:transcription antitermination factor NusG